MKNKDTMNNIMLDIETLGTGVDSIIIQVAMVKFDWEGNIGKSLTIHFDSYEEYQLGLTKTKETIDWWNKTNPSLFKVLLTENLVSVKQGLNKISKFVGAKDYIWCHATFDAPILANLYTKADIKIPWGFKKVKDIRTLVDLAQLDLSNYNWDAEKTHDALDDCRFQIKYCCDAFTRIRTNR